VDERILPDETPEGYAVRVALDKARIVAARSGNSVVIAADTIVVLNRAILGKPVSEADAVRMLTMLSGRMHRVITGLAVIDSSSSEQHTAYAVTRVWFRDLAPEMIASYAASGEPLDKAGAYGIQGRGALFVERIDGCYFNVVGLPLALLTDLISAANVKVL
jgi:septum formation protein